ncbi:hypothetical protein Esti_004686 [Eimeria stiedai]
MAHPECFPKETLEEEEGVACASHKPAASGPLGCLRSSSDCSHVLRCTDTCPNSSSSSSWDVACASGSPDARLSALCFRSEVSGDLRAFLLPGAPRQEGEAEEKEVVVVNRPFLLEALPVVPLTRLDRLSSPSSQSCRLLAEASSSSSSCTVLKGLDTLNARRCSNSGAASDHVSVDRQPSRVVSSSSKTASSSRVTSSSCCSKTSGSSSSSSSSPQQALPWLPQRRFSFSGVTARSLWNSRACACRPSPIVAATRSSSSSGLLTLLSARGQAPPLQVASSSRRCSNSSSGRESSNSSDGSRSSVSSSSSIWEGERQQLLPAHAAASPSQLDDGVVVLAYDDPLRRLQTLRVQEQPRSPLLLRCCTPQAEDMLQRLGGDNTCPAAAELPPAAAAAAGSDADSNNSDSSRPPQIPATVESFYGFTWGPEVTTRVAAYEKKTAAQRNKQVKRWRAHLARDPNLEDRKTVKKLVRRGIPDDLRQAFAAACCCCWGELWARFLRADALLASDPAAFERLQEEELPRDVSGQIELDLPRTFPNNARFRRSGGIAALRRVLRGFAAARPAVGYCQGLNFLAGTLLLFQNQQLALASLLQLVVSWDRNTGLQIGRYYSSGMPDLRRDLKVLELLIRQRSPRVYQVLKRTGVEVEWLAAEWFLCLFCTSCPEPTVLRIWDCLMLEGPKILFRVALGVIFSFEAQLAKMHLLEQVMGFLKSNLALLVEHNELLQSSFKKLRSFPRHKLQQLQHTVAAGLLDPYQRAQEQQEEEQQQQHQAAAAATASRRLRLLSFARLSRSEVASEAVAQQQPASQQASRWRQRLVRVSMRVRKRGSIVESSIINPSSYAAASHVPQASSLSATQLRCLDASDPADNDAQQQQQQQQPQPQVTLPPG